MPKPKTHDERTRIINRIIELVKEHGRITTKEVVAMFNLHRTTAEKYIRLAVQRGELIRYGRCGIFRDQRAIIDFDLSRFSKHRVAMQP
jgi:DeoR/GlpR family transcriptional regulator of sugar metabolism